MECPRCHTSSTITTYNIDQDFNIYYYLACSHCGWPIKQIFYIPKEIIEMYKGDDYCD